MVAGWVLWLPYSRKQYKCNHSIYVPRERGHLVHTQYCSIAGGGDGGEEEGGRVRGFFRVVVCMFSLTGCARNVFYHSSTSEGGLQVQKARPGRYRGVYTSNRRQEGVEGGGGGCNCLPHEAC